MEHASREEASSVRSGRGGDHCTAIRPLFLFLTSSSQAEPAHSHNHNNNHAAAEQGRSRDSPLPTTTATAAGTHASVSSPTRTALSVRTDQGVSETPLEGAAVTDNKMVEKSGDSKLGGEVIEDAPHTAWYRIIYKVREIGMCVLIIFKSRQEEYRVSRFSLSLHTIDILFFLCAILCSSVREVFDFDAVARCTIPSKALFLWAAS